MPSKNRTQTISSEKQVAVSDQAASRWQSNPKPGKQSKIRRKRILVISAVIVLVLADGYFVWNAFQYEDTDDAQVDGHVMPLGARINGYVNNVFVSEGQFVHAGEALMSRPSMQACSKPEETPPELVNVPLWRKSGTERTKCTSTWKGYAFLDLRL